MNYTSTILKTFKKVQMNSFCRILLIMQKFETQKTCKNVRKKKERERKKERKESAYEQCGLQRFMLNSQNGTVHMLLDLSWLSSTLAGSWLGGCV
jgi:hypothetical protein